MDRNYAKYWLFSGTPGFFIEQVCSINNQCVVKSLNNQFILPKTLRLQDDIMIFPLIDLWFQGWWGGKYFDNIQKKANSLNTSNTSEDSEDSGVLTRQEPMWEYIFTSFKTGFS